MHLFELMTGCGFEDVKLYRSFKALPAGAVGARMYLYSSSHLQLRRPSA